jgi:hypothetical protein
MNAHDAYASVDQSTDPYGIYLSTLMLCEMFDIDNEETKSAGNPRESI